MRRIKLAIPTKGDKGMKDVVSEVFGKAKKFTVIEITDDNIVSAKVVENPAALYKHGAGPIVVKMLVDMGVTAVAAREFGPGASALLEQHNVKRFEIKPGILVEEAVKSVLRKNKSIFNVE